MMIYEFTDDAYFEDAAGTCDAFVLGTIPSGKVVIAVLENNTLKVGCDTPETLNAELKEKGMMGAGLKPGLTRIIAEKALWILNQSTVAFMPLTNEEKQAFIDVVNRTGGRPYITSPK